MVADTNSKISVIVPLYNTRKYILQCIRSIIQQSHHNIQLIIVDDCSTDGSLEIIRNWLAKHPCKPGIKVKIIAQDKNQGVEVARVAGLAHAIGEYVTFVDADDWLHKDALKTMLGYAVQYDADLVDGSAFRTMDSHGWVKKYSGYDFQIIEAPRLQKDYTLTFFGASHSLTPQLKVWMCDKLFHRKLFNLADVSPVGFRFGEDSLLTLRIFKHVKKYVCIPEPLYFYRYGGMTSTYKPWLWNEIKQQYYWRRKYLIDNEIDGGGIWKAKFQAVS